MFVLLLQLVVVLVVAENLTRLAFGIVVVSNVVSTTALVVVVAVAVAITAVTRYPHNTAFTSTSTTAAIAGTLTSSRHFRTRLDCRIKKNSYLSC